MGLKEYEIYRGDDSDLVTVIRARTYDGAEWKARKMGYGPEFRIVEVEEYGGFDNYGPYTKKEC